MQDFILSGRVVDLILVVMAAEAALLLMRRNAALSPVDVLFVMAPGACLLLALRAALTGADWTWIAAAIAASFPFHLVDLARRGRAARRARE